MLHALIDIGSNTIRLAIYDLTTGELVFKNKKLIAPAAFIEGGKMTSTGISEIVAAITSYQAFLAAFGISRISSFTTAAIRTATNRDDIIAQITAATGLEVEVLSGEEEACLGFLAAITGGDGLLIDIGGSSTEFVFFTAGAITTSLSLPLGAVRLAKEFVAGVLPTVAEFGAIKEHVKAELAKNTPAVEVKELIAIGGTAKSLSLYTGGAVLEKAALAALPELYLAERLTDAKAKRLLMTVGERIESVFSGLAVIVAVMEYFSVDTAEYKDTGIREGFLTKYLGA